MSLYKLILKWRRFLGSTPWFKKCFGCDNVYPLILFKINSSKFQRPAAKGRCFECRACGMVRKYKNRVK